MIHNILRNNNNYETWLYHLSHVYFSFANIFSKHDKLFFGTFLHLNHKSQLRRDWDMVFQWYLFINFILDRDFSVLDTVFDNVKATNKYRKVVNKLLFLLAQWVSHTKNTGAWFNANKVLIDYNRLVSVVGLNR